MTVPFSPWRPHQPVQPIGPSYSVYCMCNMPLLGQKLDAIIERLDALDARLAALEENNGTTMAEDIEWLEKVAAWEQEEISGEDS